METREFIKYMYYNLVAKFYLIRSSRHLKKAALLNDKAEAYMEKQSRGLYGETKSNSISIN